MTRLCESTVNAPAGTAVIVFAREPVPGKVKTRLAASLAPRHGDPERLAAALYAACLEVLFHTLRDLPFPALPFVSSDSVATGRPGSCPGFFSRFTDGPVFAQRGGDLGVRMRDALERGFARYDKLLLIGSDVPRLSTATLVAARAALEEHDCVLGPAEDGGYYLIGFTKSGFCDCFTGVPWSTSAVLARTLERLAGKRTAFLEPYRDVDTAEDLDALAAAPDCPPAILAVLREYGYRP